MQVSTIGFDLAKHVSRFMASMPARRWWSGSSCGALRRLLVVGAMAVVRHARRRPGEHPWIAKLLAKKPVKLVAIAVANKTARIAWAIMNRGGTYRAPALATAA